MDNYDSILDEKKSDGSHFGQPEKDLIEAMKATAPETHHYVAGGDGDKGLMDTVKEKAVEAYHYVVEKVGEAKHAVTGDLHQGTPEAFNPTTEGRVELEHD